MNDQNVQVSLAMTPGPTQNFADTKKEEKALEHAFQCLDKLRDVHRRQMVWFEILQHCLTVVTHEEVETTPQELEDIRISICHDNASQHLQLLRYELRYRRDVSARIALVKCWLKKGKLSYSDIKATDEEIVLFGELAQ